MYYIKRNTNTWDIEQRLASGYINYITIPKPDSYKRKGDGYQFFLLDIPIFSTRRTDVVISQGESFDSFLSALLNPSPRITGGAGGSGGEVDEKTVEVSVGTYLIDPSDKNILAMMDCTVVLPKTSLGRFRIRIHANGFRVSIKAAVGDTIEGDAALIIEGGEMVTVSNIGTTDPNKYSLGD